MKTNYIVEVYASTSGMGYPEWLKEATHKTLEAARNKRTALLKTTDWTAKEIRIVECTRKVIR